jgi:hypothetical protein
MKFKDIDKLKVVGPLPDNIKKNSDWLLPGYIFFKKNNGLKVNL